MSEPHAFLAVERSLKALAVGAMERQSSVLVSRVHKAILKGNYAGAHDVIPHVSFSHASAIIQRQAEPLMKSAYLLGASFAHRGLDNTPHDVFARMPEQAIRNVIKTHATIVGQRSEILVRNALGKFLSRAQAAYHERGYPSTHRVGIRGLKGEGKTLYARRDLLNAGDLITWAKKVGFKTTLAPDEMHVTVAYSKQPFDWSKLERDDDEDGLIASGDGSYVHRLGDGGAVALVFRSALLRERWHTIRDAGASWDYPTYRPHVTISWDAEDLDLASIPPYQGELVFGPEVFEEIQENWASTVTEKRLKRDIVLKDFDQGLVDSLNAAVNSNSQMMASLSANLSTSRLVSYGFLVEGDAIGLQTYRLQAVLDDKTSKICQELDGRTFPVQIALEHMDRIMRTDNPEDLKSLAPFLTDKAAEAFAGMSDEDLEAQGVMIPPFHPHCRTIAVPDDQPDVEIDNVTTTPVEKRDRFALVFKSNPYHDADDVREVPSSRVALAREARSQ